MKGLPLAYQKDMQEDKQGAMEAFGALSLAVRAMTGMVADLVPDEARMKAAAGEGYATATDLADYLVKKGLTFRDAHEIVAAAVKQAQQRSIDLSELSLEDLQMFHASIGTDVYHVLTLRGSLDARNLLGGTAPAQVLAQVARHRQRLG